METNSGSGSSSESVTVTRPVTSKPELLRVISQNSSRVTYINNFCGRSQVWKRFKLIRVDDNPVDFVKCEECHQILTWKSTQGTSSLSKHSCTKKTTSNMCSDPGSIEVFGWFPNAQPTLMQLGKPKFAPGVLKDLNKKILIGLARDLRPLRAVEGEGFLEVAQTLVNFGAKHGRIDVNDCIYHRTTLKKQLSPTTIDMKAQIREKINCSLSFPKLAFPFDMWSDKHKQRSFLSFSVHFIDKNFMLRNFMLGVDEFEMEQKTTSNVREECTRILGDFVDEEQIQLVMEESKSVTDGGSNMLHVFPHRLPCQCHKLNLLLEWTFNDKQLSDSARASLQDSNGKKINAKKAFRLSEKCPKIKGSLVAVKELVAYFKRSGLNASLKTTLKQDVTTRWNSQLIMLESYLSTAKDIKHILCEKNKLDKLSNIYDSVIEELVMFLRPFRECSEILSGDKQCTINEVALWFGFLQKHIESVPEGYQDSEELQNLKKQASICFNEYCGSLDPICYVACILNPKYKSLKFADTNKKNEALSLLKTLIDREKSLLEIPSPPSSQLPDPGNIIKKRRFADFEDTIVEQAEICELERYMNLRAPTLNDEAGGKFNILTFWREATQFPMLRRIASWVLAIPASQASDERVFSATGITLSPRRTELNGSTLSALTFIHSNYKKLV